MKLGEILSWLRGLAPEDTAMDGDPVGLLIEPPARDISRVVVCLDATPAIANAAAQANAELIICHHPLIYRPMAKIQDSEPVGKTVLVLAREGIALYAMHTNWDRAFGGINDTLARKIGLKDIRALGGSGDSQIPRIGAISPCTLQVLAARIAQVLDTSGENAVRYSGQFSERIVQTLAVCGGAGASFLTEAVAAGADALLTADIRHHEFIDANGRGAILLTPATVQRNRPAWRLWQIVLRNSFRTFPCHSSGRITENDPCRALSSF